MKTALVILAVLVLALVAAQLVATARLRALQAEMEAALRAGPAMRAPVDGLPEPIRRAAERSGAGEGGPYRALRMEQAVEMQLNPGAGFVPSTAVQTVALGAPGFAWFAEVPGWPVPKARAVDAYVEGRGQFLVRLLGSVPVVSARGPVFDRSEAMRYLAELPWAPDAILGNPEIRWSARPDGWFEAALELPGGRVAVRFALEDGDIARMHADARPDLDAEGREIARVWQGRFGDYAEIGGRRIPMSGEVGYVTDGVYTPYFRGRVTAYELLR